MTEVSEDDAIEHIRQYVHFVETEFQGVENLAHVEILKLRRELALRIAQGEDEERSADEVFRDLMFSKVWLLDGIE